MEQRVISVTLKAELAAFSQAAQYLDHDWFRSFLWAPLKFYSHFFNKWSLRNLRFFVYWIPQSMVVEERVARLQNKCRGIVGAGARARARTTPWVLGESTRETRANERDSVSSRGRDAIYMSGLRGSSAHLSASRVITRDSALFALGTASSFLESRSSERISSIFSAAPSSERFDPPRAILPAPNKSDRPRFHYHQRDLLVHGTFLTAIRKQIPLSFREGSIISRPFLFR